MKKIILTSAITIVLCLALIAGATFALFTNDLNDGTIGIITSTGTVSIDIVDKNGDTLENKALSFITPSGVTQKGVIYVEPGLTFRTQGFLIENQGSVPVNFTLSFSKDSNIDEVEFYNTFQVWIAKEGDDFSQATDITEFKVYDLKPNKSSDTYYLIIRMREDAGDAFQNKAYTGIGVTVYAVQSNAGPIKE